MNRKKGVIALLVPLALCLILAGAALAMSSASYSLPWQVFSGGGGLKSSASYRLGDVAGQPAVGVSQSTSYRLGTGYWAGVENLPVSGVVGYRLKNWVLAGSGAAGTSSNYRLVSTLGQPSIGRVHGADYHLEAGFWTSSAGGEIPPPLAGDATGDGNIDAVDITKVERIIAGLDISTPGADANLDGAVNALDITKVERLIAELD